MRLNLRSSVEGATRRRGAIAKASFLCLALQPALASNSLATAPANETSLSPCVSAELSLEEPYETVRIGGLAFASDAVRGGPPECVSSVSTDSENVRVSLQKTGKRANVRITAFHEGYANVTVTDVNGVTIGVILVSVYPREPRSHKGGR